LTFIDYFWLMPKMRVYTRFIFSLVLSCILLTSVSSCTRDVTCPTGHQDAKDSFAAAEKGKATTKKRTDNGLIKKKNPSKKKKRK